jgi:hypothetical protein
MLGILPTSKVTHQCPFRPRGKDRTDQHNVPALLQVESINSRIDVRGPLEERKEVASGMFAVQLLLDDICNDGLGCIFAGFGLFLVYYSNLLAEFRNRDDFRARLVA